MPTFQGKTYLVPQAVAHVDVSAAAKGALGLLNVAAVIGEATGGKPGDVFTYNNFAQLQSVHRSGPAVDGSRLLFQPSDRTGGATLVRFVRVNPATQFAGTIADSVPETTINLLSSDYGSWQSGVKWKIEAGEAGDWQGQDVTFQFGDDTVTVDQLGKALRVKYTETCTTAVLNISGNVLTTTITGGSYETVDNFSLDLTATQYDTIAKVYAAFAEHPRYDAELNPNAHDGMTAVASQYFNTQTDQDIKAVWGMQTAHPYLMVDWINTHVPWVTATAAKTTVPDVVDWDTWSSGGSEGTTLTSHWENALTALEETATQLLWVASESNTIHALLKAHCRALGNRIGFVGGAAGETVAQAVTRAGALNSDRMVLGFPGVKLYDATLTIATLSPMYTAAMLCGLHAGVPIYEPITHKYLAILGLEKDLTLADRQTLQLGGVCCVNQNFSRVTGRSTGYWCSKGCSTVQSNLSIWNADGTTPEPSLRRICDALKITIEDLVNETFVGRSSRYLLANLQAYVQSLLDEFEAAGWLTPTLDPDTGQELPGWRNVQVRQQGDAWYVDFEVNLTTPANFVFVTAHVLP